MRVLCTRHCEKSDSMSAPQLSEALQTMLANPNGLLKSLAECRFFAEQTQQLKAANAARTTAWQPPAAPKEASRQEPPLALPEHQKMVEELIGPEQLWGQKRTCAECVAAGSDLASTGKMPRRAMTRAGMPVEVLQVIKSFLRHGTLASLHNATAGWTAERTGAWPSVSRPPTFALRVDYTFTSTWLGRLEAVSTQVEACVQELFLMFRTYYMKVGNERETLHLFRDGHGDRILYEPRRGEVEHLMVQNIDDDCLLTLQASRSVKKVTYKVTIHDLLQVGPGKWKPRMRKIEIFLSDVDSTWMTYHAMSSLMAEEPPQAIWCARAQLTYKMTLFAGPPTRTRHYPKSISSLLRTKTKVAWLEDVLALLSRLAAKPLQVRPDPNQSELHGLDDEVEHSSEDELERAWLPDTAKPLRDQDTVYLRLRAAADPLMAVSKSYSQVLSVSVKQLQSGRGDQGVIATCGQRLCEGADF